MQLPYTFDIQKFVTSPFECFAGSTSNFKNGNLWLNALYPGIHDRHYFLSLDYGYDRTPEAHFHIYTLPYTALPLERIQAENSPWINDTLFENIDWQNDQEQTDFAAGDVVFPHSITVNFAKKTIVLENPEEVENRLFGHDCLYSLQFDSAGTLTKAILHDPSDTMKTAYLYNEKGDLTSYENSPLYPYADTTQCSKIIAAVTFNEQKKGAHLQVHYTENNELLLQEKVEKEIAAEQQNAEFIQKNYKIGKQSIKLIR